MTKWGKIQLILTFTKDFHMWDVFKHTGLCLMLTE
ncbi:hypothetical protein HDEF_0851 [Candidatus Hamiltonella defensa 5AT (Acyrthosiphon pisum)]|uniref:Uncharacterized protein n=1 Tax=Hamiltonella defensa subsp. Acyrthosiphon pisum (strain 5AT) TaxID=572265 RepID=C4K4S8_HAMD5|nr:hypothetical protein HDEF_0851 [Candidatus Hamiltonella defensa 5AT (Acyrthosiphon pisum)]